MKRQNIKVTILSITLSLGYFINAMTEESTFVKELGLYIDTVVSRKETNEKIADLTKSVMDQALNYVEALSQEDSSKILLEWGQHKNLTYKFLGTYKSWISRIRDTKTSDADLLLQCQTFDKTCTLIDSYCTKLDAYFTIPTPNEKVEILPEKQPLLETRTSKIPQRTCCWCFWSDY